MKHSSLIFAFLCIVACSSKKTMEIDMPLIVNNNSAPNICPNGGNCSLKILKNKSIATKTMNNAANYDIVDDKTKMVIDFKYDKDLNQATYDGGMAEEIVFEIDAKDYSKTLIDEELKEAKVFYRRSCACRGRAGLFEITKGKLEVTVHNGKINLNFDFDSGSEPQATKNFRVIDGKL